MIEEYRFGSIKINGKVFEHDVEVCWEPDSFEVLKWWRNESHVVDIDDLERAIAQKPDTIIIGTGAYGIAEITDQARQVVRSKDIILIVDKTEEAVKTFNIHVESVKEEENSRRIIGLFHLTC